ncbi:hypothetical protein [Micropruina sp.]
MARAYGSAPTLPGAPSPRSPNYFGLAEFSEPEIVRRAFGGESGLS